MKDEIEKYPPICKKKPDLANQDERPISVFNGMTDRESIAFQLKNWVEGKPLHNTVRDECCPDFSCCNGGEIMPQEVRYKFSKAVEDNDKKAQWAILGMGLDMLTSKLDVDVHIAGEEGIEH